MPVMRVKVAIGLLVVLMVLLALGGVGFAAEKSKTSSKGESIQVVPNITVIINQPASQGMQETPEYISQALSIAQSAEAYMEKTLALLGIIVSVLALVVGAILTVFGVNIWQFKKDMQTQMDKLKASVRKADSIVGSLQDRYEEAEKLGNEIPL